MKLTDDQKIALLPFMSTLSDVQCAAYCAAIKLYEGGATLEEALVQFGVWIGAAEEPQARENVRTILGKYIVREHG